MPQVYQRAPRWRSSIPHETPAPHRSQSPHSPQHPGRPPITAAQVIGRFGGGGAERLAYNLAVGVGEKGFRSLAVALRTADLEGEEVPGTVVLSELRATRRRPLSEVRAMHRLRRLVRRHGVQVLHVHGHDALPFCALAVLGMRRRPRLVFTWHAPEHVLTERGVGLTLMRWALRRCDRVYGSSREVARSLTHRAGLAPPAAAFRNGVAAVDRVGGEDGDEAGPVIVWAARLVPTKEPQMLIRAAATLRAEGLRFRVVLAGSSAPQHRWYAEETYRLVDELGVGDLVSMPGWVGDTAGLFAGASIAVQTSRTEGLSLGLLEQMMAGLAVVATDVGDTAAAVRDGETGVLIPPGDEGALTDALRGLLTDPRRRAELGRRAREYALSEFTIERMAERAIEEYGRVVGV